MNVVGGVSNENLIKKTRVNKTLVLFIYNINSIHTVHRWPFVWNGRNVCLMSFFAHRFGLCFREYLTQRLSSLMKW